MLKAPACQPLLLGGVQQADLHMPNKNFGRALELLAGAEGRSRHLQSRDPAACVMTDSEADAQERLLHKKR